LGQQALDLLAGFGNKDIKIIRQDEVQGVGDQGIVIDDQQGWF
jgi:hypothetical protein